MQRAYGAWLLDSPGRDSDERLGLVGNVRDFGLMLGALTLARLAVVYDPPLRQRS